MTTTSIRRGFRARYFPEYRELLKLGFPVLLTQLGVILMSFTDTMMVGAYGVDQLASSAFVNSIFLIPGVMLMGLANGITPLVGALFSKKSYQEAGRVARAGLQINTIVALLFTLLLGVLYFFLDRFGQPDELMPIVRPYFITLLFTPLPQALFNALAQTCNGVTDTRSPMWMVLGAVFANILLNWVLIFGHCGFPELGLTGAGIATATSRYLCFFGMLAWMLNRKYYRPYRPGLRDGNALGTLRRKVWVTSYPVMIQAGVECSLWSFGAVVCGWFGKIQLAAYQVVTTIGQLGFMTYMSFGVALSIRVANFCGLRDGERAGLTTRAGFHLILVLATVASLIFVLLNRHLLGWFTPDAEVISAALLLFPPLILYQYMDAAQLTFINAIRGTSQVKPLLWIAIISYIVVGAPVLLLFSLGFGWESIGIYYSFNVALLVAAVMAYIVFRGIKV